MDREISISLKRKRAYLNYLKWGGGIILLLIVIWIFRGFIKPSIHPNEFRMAIVETGNVEATIQASGVVIPAYKQIITSSVQAKIDSVLINVGDSVDAGYSILKLNTEFTKIQYEKLQDEQALTQNKALQKKLQLEKQINDLESQYHIQKIKVESQKSTWEYEKYLKEVGGGTEEAVRQAEMNLKTSQIEQKRLESQINSLKSSMLTELSEQNLNINIQQKSLSELQRKMEQAEVKSAINGIVTWVNDEIGTVVNAGDEIAHVSDLSSFKIEGSISDKYADKLQIGGMVIIKVQEEEIRGIISNIRPAVNNGEITFIIKLKEQNASLLRANLKVDVYIVTTYREKVLRLRNRGGLNGAGKKEVFVVNGDKAVKRQVIIGESNFDFVEIKEGLSAGEKVIVTDMDAYMYKSEINIEE